MPISSANSFKIFLATIVLGSWTAPSIGSARPKGKPAGASAKTAPASNCPIQFVDELRNTTQGNLQSLLGGGLSCDSKGAISLAEVARFDCNSRVTNVGRALRVTDDLDKIAVQMFMQELAGNSHAQANCRLGFFNRYSANGTDRTRLNRAAQKAFEQIADDLKTLSVHKATMTKELAALNLRNAGDRGMGALTYEGRQDYEKKIAETEVEISKLILKVPMGYDPDVARNIAAMGTSGVFDENQFQTGMNSAVEKYAKASEYYRTKFTVVDEVNNRGSYCLGLDYRNLAGRSGQVEHWVNQLPAKTAEEKSFRTKISCRLEKTYDVGQSRFNTGVAVAGFASMLFPPAAGARALASGIQFAAKAGSALNTGMRAGAAVNILMAMDTFRKQCFPDKALVSGDRLNDPLKCDPEADFNRAIEEPSTSACAAGAVMLAAAPLHIQTALKANRLIKAAKNLPLSQLAGRKLRLIDMQGKELPLDTIANGESFQVKYVMGKTEADDYIAMLRGGPRNGGHQQIEILTDMREAASSGAGNLLFEKGAKGEWTVQVGGRFLSSDNPYWAEKLAADLKSMGIEPTKITGGRIGNYKRKKFDDDPDPQ